MREDILAASLRVFQDEGALRFTTGRVAEAAGVSVGSLYQYFPNKHALAHALHEQAVQGMLAEAHRLLADETLSHRMRLRVLARTFFRSEAEEMAAMGAVLRDAELLLHNDPAAGRRYQEEILTALERYVCEGCGTGPSERTRRCARLIALTLEGVGKSAAEGDWGADDVDQYADACADMLAGYIGLA
ncbi:MAG: TetR/AcrR family transcriptional regulator [Caulobacteraceae bacterium]|nr:TetR/AcrR family transcriptional regulator [Caulobacteraceae bacterium]